MTRKIVPSQQRLGQYTPLHRNRWRNPEYTKRLSWDEKAMLSQLMTHDGISAAGVVNADAALLASKHPDRTAEQIEQYLSSLAAKGVVIRRGNETFVTDWFYWQPGQVRSPKTVTAILNAARRIGDSALVAQVMSALFESILDIEALDKRATSAEVKRLLQGFSEEAGLSLPARLRP